MDFVESLSDIPTCRRRRRYWHKEALKFHKNFSKHKQDLVTRLVLKFNSKIFGDQLDPTIIWCKKLRTTAGYTSLSMKYNENGDICRKFTVTLATKVVDTPQRLRDTLLHELCHGATWIIDGHSKAGHGPLWKKWVNRASRAFPCMDTSVCHEYRVNYKYTFKCSNCLRSTKRHTKSINIEKVRCVNCHSKFEVFVNRKNKAGVVISTPAKKRQPNEFAMFVKENYAKYKHGRTSAQVMKVLGKKYSAKKGMKS